MVPVSPSKVYIILITAAGSVDRRMVDFDAELDETTLADVRARVATTLSSVSLSEVDGAMSTLAESVPPTLRPIIDDVRTALKSQVDSHRKDRLVVAGTPKLVRADIDFAGSVAPVLDAIEEQVTLLRLFGEMRAQGDDSGVRIGREMSDDLSDTAIISASVEDFATILCFDEVTNTAPFPKVVHAPVWDFISL
jgi:heat-inducible transcriptional repressor